MTAWQTFPSTTPQSAQPSQSISIVILHRQKSLVTRRGATRQHRLIGDTIVTMFKYYQFGYIKVKYALHDKRAGQILKPLQYGKGHPGRTGHFRIILMEILVSGGNLLVRWYIS